MMKHKIYEFKRQYLVLDSFWWLEGSRSEWIAQEKDKKQN